MVRRALRRRFGHGVAAYNRGSRLISRQTDAALAGRVKEGRFCTGRMRNGPGKRYPDHEADARQAGEAAEK